MKVVLLMGLDKGGFMKGYLFGLGAMLVGGDVQPAEVNTGVEICVENKVRWCRRTDSNRHGVAPTGF